MDKLKFKILGRRIFQGETSVMDGGDAWLMIDKDSDILSKIDKKNETWLMAYWQKWSGQRLTKFGEWYIHNYYSENNDTVEKGIENELEKGGKAAVIGERRTFKDGKTYEKIVGGWRPVRKDGKAAGVEKREETIDKPIKEDKDIAREYIKELFNGTGAIQQIESKDINTEVLCQMVDLIGLVDDGHAKYDRVFNAFTHKKIKTPKEFINKSRLYIDVMLINADKIKVDSLPANDRKDLFDILSENKEKYDNYGFSTKDIIDKIAKYNKSVSFIEKLGNITEKYKNYSVEEMFRDNYEFFEGDDFIKKGSDGLEFEHDYFVEQIQRNFIKVQENVIGLKDNVLPNLDFFELSVVNYYTFHYESLNKCLRGDLVKLNKIAHPIFKAFITAFIKSIAKLPADTENSHFNRFLKLDSDTLEQYKEGVEIQWSAFSSFTKNDTDNLGLKVTNNTKIVCKNDNTSFKDISKGSDRPGQNEVIISPPATVKVLKKYKEGNMNIIEVELVNI